jgi:hypothetical protein
VTCPPNNVTILDAPLQQWFLGDSEPFSFAGSLSSNSQPNLPLGKG